MNILSTINKDDTQRTQRLIRKIVRRKNICYYLQLNETIKNIYSTTKNYKKENTDYLKSVIIEHPKTPRKGSKAIRQSQKVSKVRGTCKNSVRLLYSEAKKCLDAKITKRYHACRNFEFL